MIIETPSRLHITLIDLNGVQGRIDGGVGLTIDNPCLHIEAESSENGINTIFSEKSRMIPGLVDDYSKKIDIAASKVIKTMNYVGGFEFSVDAAYPPHSGLGSGTQLSLAVAKLITQLNGDEINAHELAKIVGRGGTSGLGVESFENGGFIIDGGHSSCDKSSFLPSSASKASPPPIIARYNFPEDWNIILTIPDVERGVSGSKEIDAFQKHCPIKLEEVEKLSHLILMKLMPAVVESDLDAFGSAINIIQNTGFKKVENKLQNAQIKSIMADLRNSGAAGVGMSSFGPTIYSVTDTNKRAVLKAAENSIKDIGGQVIQTRARNNGAKII